MIYKTYCQSPVGKLWIASDGQAITGLWIEGQKNFGTEILGAAKELSELSIFKDASKWIYDYFGGKRPSIDALPISPGGNDFKRAVFSALREIPYGEVVTYAEIAKRTALIMGKEKMGAQAVASGIAHNPIMIMIPCHRVISADGSLGGYAAGAETKARLLRLEGARNIFKLHEKSKSDTERILAISGTRLDFSED